MQMCGSHSAFCRLTPRPSSAISIVIIYHQLVFLPRSWSRIFRLRPPISSIEILLVEIMSFIADIFLPDDDWWCLLLDKCPDLVIIMFWEERLVAAAATYLWSQDELGVAYWSAQITKCSFSINCNAHLNKYIMFIYDWWADQRNQTTYLAKKFFNIAGIERQSIKSNFEDCIPTSAMVLARLCLKNSNRPPSHS